MKEEIQGSLISSSSSSSSSPSEVPKIIWDCGSPLYDSFELSSLSHLIERHLMMILPSSSSSPSSSLTSSSSMLMSIASRLEGDHVGKHSLKDLWKRKWKRKMEWEEEGIRIKKAKKIKVSGCLSFNPNYFFWRK